MCLLATPASGQDGGQAPWQLGMPTFNGLKLPPAVSVSPEGAPAELPGAAAELPGAAAELPGAAAELPQAAVELPPAPSVTDASQASHSVPLTPPSPLPPPLPAAEAGAPAEATPEASASPIGKAIDAGVIPEPAPLQEETVSWYEVPWRWISRGWENHAELGLDGAAGNAETLAFQTGLEMKRKTDTYTLAMDFDYRQASNRNAVTEDNGRYNVDYDRIFNDSAWSAFGKFGLEWDRFKAFNLRVNLNGGAGYHWIRTDAASFVTRFGAGASQEIGAPDDDWKPEAVFGMDGEYQVNRYNKVKGKMDYFPAWEDFGDYRLVTDLAWEILLDDSDNLSLKLAATDRYDSTPQGFKPNDIYYSLLLLVKF